MTRHLVGALALVLGLGCSTSTGNLNEEQDASKTETLAQDQQAGEDVPVQDATMTDAVADEPLVTENTMSPKKAKLAGYYEAVTYEVQPAVEAYPLPLQIDSIVNWNQVAGLVGVEGRKESLLANGFVVTPFVGLEGNPLEDFVEFYQEFSMTSIPVLVTADTWLHLYHVQFDETLKTLEEDVFYNDILVTTETLLNHQSELAETSEGLLQQAAQRNVAYLRIARELLTVSDDPDSAPGTETPAFVADVVAQELALIEAHEGFADSPLFSYKEDYSQYVPRGHYTRSERLKSYFRTLMWYGRLTMLLKGGDPACEYDQCPALVTPEEADIQTVQALLLTMDLNQLEAQGSTILQRWERIYAATTFFVGYADDLSHYEYLQAIHKVAGENPELAVLVDTETLFELRATLMLMRSPQIYGGTGGQVIVVGSVAEITPEMLEELLEKSKGFRFMGQRFVPDSYIMGRLVSPGAGALTGSTDAFTAVLSDAGWIRGFPRGLDVMAVLGSDRAREWLTLLGDDAYSKYDESFADMESFIAEQTVIDWHQNLYWGWLYTLQSLLAPPLEGTQTFMQTQGFVDKSLNTALSSWAQLRHDTILYAKQSYTPSFESSLPETPPGYVEPNPEFFARLLELNKMTLAGLEALDALPEASRTRLEAMSTALERMLDITVAELNNQSLSETDNAYIAGIALTLEGLVAGVEDTGVKTTLVADVHTDQNSKKVLEVGTGYVELLVAAVRFPNGNIFLTVGPVFSFFEFRHPMDDRLTDEAWREILSGPQNAVPPSPEWTQGYRVE